MSRNTLIAFWAVAALHMISLVDGPRALEFGTKALLMPLLALWVAAGRGPRLIIAALVASACGDIALEIDGLFIPGMACFAVAHICYITFFVRGLPAGGASRRWAAPVSYGLAWAILITILWPGLGDLRIPVAAYSLVLTATAITSSWYGRRTGIGGCLFLISDALIALRLAEIDIPWSGLLVMATYIAAQYLLASGAMTSRNSVRATNTATTG